MTDGVVGAVRASADETKGQGIGKTIHDHSRNVINAFFPLATSMVRPRQTEQGGVIKSGQRLSLVRSLVTKILQYVSCPFICR